MLDTPLDLPVEKLQTLHSAVEALKSVQSVVGIVLGGSYACGLARPDSDMDIGVYYRERSSFSVDQVRHAAQKICTAGSVPVVTGTYEWGPWVNGGAWIQTPAGKVDFLYKNLDQVHTVIEEAQRGIWRHDYDQQPPYGFRSIVFLGETSICIPLYDPEGAIAELKKSVVEYPESLRNRIVQETLWGAEFTLWSCRAFSFSADVYNTVGCMTRVAQFLVQALFSLNRRFFVSDKYVSRVMEHLPLRPRDFMPRLAAVLSNPGGNPAELNRSFDQLSALWIETVELTAGAYKPRYDLKVLLP